MGDRAYDARLRPATETHPESGTVTFDLYDEAGRLRQQTDAWNKVTTYTFDTNGRPTTITAGDRVTTLDYEAGTDNVETVSVRR